MYDSTFPYDLRFEMQPSQGESAVLEKVILGTRGGNQSEAALDDLDARKRMQEPRD